MAIEGPLRELGIHDVFQLLDLSRKTGRLMVTSELRDNEGVVYFDSGRVVHAQIRSNPHPLGAMLVRSGKISEADLERARVLQTRGTNGRRLGEILVEIQAITPRELERQVRLQIEAVVFELMSWREGFFRFEECAVAEVPAEATVKISTESLLMEGARRIDEWSRIADKVPHLGVRPVLAPLNQDHAALLDLLPNEWEMLAIIDGEMDLRAIAATLGRSEFDIAKIAYGLVTTGIVELRQPERGHLGDPLATGDYATLVQQAREALKAARNDEALARARSAAAVDPASVEARLLVGVSLSRLGRLADAVEELRRAMKSDPRNSEVCLELGYALVARGQLQEAARMWDHFMRLAPNSPHAEQIRTATEAAHRLATMLEARTGV